jgi:lipoprotein-releasing system ATP-binding protein
MPQTMTRAATEGASDAVSPAQGGLAASGLHKTFASAAGPLVVLREVDLVLAPGEAIAVVGPSGAGKSTLLHVLGGLDAPTAGRLAIAGCDPYELPEPRLAEFRNRTVGFVFQDHHLLPQYTALENVLVPTVATGKPPAGSAERARDLLARVGLANRMDHRPAQLSGGERQRVALARALVMGPRLLLADEPTGSLDKANAEAVSDLLLDLQRDAGTMLVVVTHSAALAARFARVYELSEGRLCARA